MAYSIVFVCDSCTRAIEAWDDGNPYLIDSHGEKQYANHPDPDRDRCIGNDTPHLCGSCGHEFDSDRALRRNDAPNPRRRRSWRPGSWRTLRAHSANRGTFVRTKTGTLSRDGQGLDLLGSLAVTHRSELLWNRVDEVAPYPAGVVAVPELITGTAFFPGGRGVWQWDTDVTPDCPTGGVMVLGHDFHSVALYRQSLSAGAESRSQPTWRNLVRVLAEARIPLRGCFFTNFYMGLRQQGAATGKFPGASDAAFRSRCASFLLAQIGVVRPRVIVTLGRYVPRELATISPDLRPWRNVRSIRDIDAVGPLRSDVSFDTDGGTVTASVVALTHPSLRHLSVSRRVYRSFSGHAAEIHMLLAAVNVER